MAVGFDEKYSKHFTPRCLRCIYSRVCGHTGFEQFQTRRVKSNVKNRKSNVRRVYKKHIVRYLPIRLVYAIKLNLLRPYRTYIQQFLNLIVKQQMLGLRFPINLKLHFRNTVVEEVLAIEKLWSSDSGSTTERDRDIERARAREREREKRETAVTEPRGGSVVARSRIPPFPPPTTAASTTTTTTLRIAHIFI